MIEVNNEDPNLTIEWVVALIQTVDRIKLTETHTYIEKFYFAVPLDPKKTGESLVLKSESQTIKDDIDLSECDGYRVSESRPDLFLPSNCLKIGDMLMFRVGSIQYTNGTQWKAPSLLK